MAQKQKLNLDGIASQNSQEKQDYVSAAEAMKMMGVRQQTLYAYVSRGLISSLAQPGSKEKLYLRSDVERMCIRSLARTGHGALAASAMNWGDPIVPSTITEITPSGHRYRGRSAAELARMKVSFESAAELLWTGTLLDEAITWPVLELTPELKRITDSLESQDPADQLLEIFSIVTLHLGVAAGAGGATAERGQGGRTYDAARQIIHSLVGCCGYAGPLGKFVPMRPGSSVVQGLIDALQIESSDSNIEALNAILVIMADHELSPGTLCARVCASGGSALHSCLASGACAIAGLGIGRQYLRVDAFLQASTSRELMQRAKDAHARGAVVPGFVHPMYPRGDPRAKYLLSVLQRRPLLSKSSKALLTFVDRMEDELNLHPRHELGIVAVCREMNLPKQLPGALFGLARTAGWVAHIQEQRLTGSLLRPRAKFEGTSV